MAMRRCLSSLCTAKSCCCGCDPVSIQNPAFIIQPTQNTLVTKWDQLLLEEGLYLKKYGTHIHNYVPFIIDHVISIYFYLCFSLLPLFFTCVAVLFLSYCKFTTYLFKKDFKKKSSWCMQDSSMNALANKVHKQEVPCTQWYWYALHTRTTLFINHPYISSSKLSVNWRATATYEG